MTAHQRFIVACLFVFAVLATAAWVFASMMGLWCESLDRGDFQASAWLDLERLHQSR